MDTPMGPTEYAPNDKSAEANLARTAGTAVVAELRAHAKLQVEDAMTLHSAIARRNPVANGSGDDDATRTAGSQYFRGPACEPDLNRLPQLQQETVQKRQNGRE